MKKNLFYILIFVAFSYTACIEKPTYPEEPVIAYKDFIRYGNNPLQPDSVEVVISFTDNEGDIGLEQTDTVGPNGIFKYGNIWLVYYYDSANTGIWAAWDNTIATPIPFDTFKVAYRVPPVLPEGDPAEPMKGLIYVKVNPFTVVHKRIKYEVYMYDKAHHKSNTIETPPLDFQP